DVEAEAFVPTERVPPLDLREPGDARHPLVTPSLLRRVAAEVLRQERPRPDERHVAADDVPELRQLVERERAEEPSEPRQARFVRLAGRARPHRPELEQREGAGVLADPERAEQD